LKRVVEKAARSKQPRLLEGRVLKPNRLNHTLGVVKKLWEEYPALTTVEGNLEIIVKAFFRIAVRFVLPAWSWLDYYYDPMERRPAEGHLTRRLFGTILRMIAASPLPDGRQTGTESKRALRDH
jgi:hypothetical protein